jgi:uncharacterized circularly permuted ATP-grasp superfamily protein
VSRLAGGPFGDATRIHPVPVILSDRELEWLAAGTGQRARALQCFFADISYGSANFLDQPEGMPSDVVDRILPRYGHHRDDLRRCWSGRGRADVCFTYAPDLIRDKDGLWRVLEDNIGCIGGLADSYYCQREYLEAVDLDPASHSEGMPDLCRGVQAFLGDADARLVSVELGCDGHVDGQPIRESERRAALLRRLGLHVVNRTEAVTVSRIVNFPPARQRYYEAFSRGNLGLLNAPQVELLGDKCLLPYVEAMVRFYLKEEPRLHALPTRVIDGIQDVIELKSGVVKRGCGAQGSSVYFLDDAQERDQALLAVAEAGPTSFVVQELASAVALPGSLDHNRVELRPFAFVLGNDPVQSSHIPSARVPLPTQRRANLSRGAHYAAVLCEPSGGMESTEPTLYGRTIGLG